MSIFILDGRLMDSAEAAHGYLARVLRFPPYYGANLDALADCLSELGSGAVVILNDAAALRRQLGDYGERLIRVFREASAEANAFSFIERD